MSSFIASGASFRRRSSPLMLYVIITMMLFFCITPGAVAQSGKASVRLRGHVYDSLGRPMSGVRIQLRRLSASARVLASARTNPRGAYRLRVRNVSGAFACRLQARAHGFHSVTLIIRLRSGVRARRDLTLSPAPLRQNIVVAATGSPLPAAQIGQSVSVIHKRQLQALGGDAVTRALQQLAGVQVLHTGAPGGLVTVYMRGGDGSFIKLTLDGIPIQRFDFGSYLFSPLLPGGIQNLQVVRGADSVLYGSGAVSGVIAMRTVSGRGRVAPELTANTTWGSFATVAQNDRLAGALNAWDYALDFGYFGTHNQIPNDHDRDVNYLAHLGWRALSHTYLSGVVSYLDSHAGQPNAIAFYGITDRAWQSQAETYAGFNLNQLTAPHWHNEIQLSEGKVNYDYENPAPSGIPYNAGFGVNYIGLPETIRGANGYSVSGQAILDYGGAYPSVFASDTLRRNASWESVYNFSPTGSFAGGYRYYNEQGLSSGEQLSRHDNGVFGEFHDGFWNRLFLSAGAAWDRNTPFGASTSPQASLAWYPRLGAGGWLGATRLRASAGSAIKDPNLFDEASSLYQELASSGGGASIRQYGIQPMHPERSHDFDLGWDQYFLRDRLRASATVFDNREYDLIEFVPSTALPALGVPTSVASQTFGADFNSLSESDKGLELSLAARAPFGLRLHAAFTRLHARVLRSFSSDALQPAFNPAFPGIPIGAYAPLVGARPFRMAPESGSFDLLYLPHFWHRGWLFDWNAYFSSRRNDSTYLVDKNFGNTLLLPNRNLSPAFAMLNLRTGVALTSRISLHASLDNLLDQHPQEVFGYPGLGTAARIGVRFSLMRGGH